MNIKQYIKLNKPLKVRKGKYSIVYVFDDIALIHSKDPIKECLSLNWFPDSIHVPEVNDSNIQSDKAGFKVYEMPLYETNRSVKSLICQDDYFNIYLPLRKLMTNINWDYNNPYKWQNNFYDAVQQTELTIDIKDLIVSCYEACMNYSSKVMFEISPRNVAAKDGRLILLDCFFII